MKYELEVFKRAKGGYLLVSCSKSTFYFSVVDALGASLQNIYVLNCNLNVMRGKSQLFAQQKGRFFAPHLYIHI